MSTKPDHVAAQLYRSGQLGAVSRKLRRRLVAVGVRLLTPRLLRGRIVLAVVLAGGLIMTGRLMHPRASELPPQPLPLPYEFVQSPNFDDRPVGATVNCIVLHATVEPTTEGTMEIFLASPRRVSAHFVVGRDGRVVQMVRVEKRAWHAGASVLDGVDKVNDFSVGIEMVNLNDGKDPYPPEQMEAVAGIIRLIRSRYDVPDSRIVSHAQIALPAGRKTDPAGFDFDKIRAMAAALPAGDTRIEPAPAPVAPPP
jgi:N-acetylmuramoyl-L-alanine amidase